MPAPVSKAPSPTPISPTVIFDAGFNGSTDGFAFKANAFRNSNSNPKYATGQNTSQYVVVKLGGLDDNDIYNITGGWQRSFNLSRASNVTIELKYQLEQTSEYEDDEYSHALCSVDGTLRGKNSTVDYLDQVRGDGNGGANRTTGFVTITLQVNNLAAGSHNIVVGGFNNQKTYHDEVTTISFDRVKVSAVASTKRRSYLRP
jgi:hypothetical protein